MSGAPGPTEDDLEALAGFAVALADGIDDAIEPWVIGSVDRVVRSATGVAPSEQVAARARDAAARARATVSPRVRALLEFDIDDQRTGPLEIVREVVRFPTEVLREAGLAPIERDPAAVAMFPDDPYDLTPTRFADLDPDLHDPGLLWGAAKAHIHLARRRAEGRR